LKLQLKDDNKTLDNIKESLISTKTRDEMLSERISSVQDDSMKKNSQIRIYKSKLDVVTKVQYDIDASSSQQISLSSQI